MYLVMSSLKTYQNAFSTYDGNKNHLNRDLIENSQLVFRRVACSRCNITSKMFQTDNNPHPRTVTMSSLTETTMPCLVP
jgi:hypothetical protein